MDTDVALDTDAAMDTDAALDGLAPDGLALDGLAAGAPVDEEQALGRLQDARQPLVLDLDETLLLRSSTELYLDRLRPRSVACVLLVLVDLLRPWKLLPGASGRHLYRDWLRVLLPTVLMPWNLWRWRRSAPLLGAEFVNAALRDQARRRATAGTPVYVVTLGFRPVVAPLLRGMDLGRHTLLASGLLAGWRLRRDGKAGALEACAGPELLATAAVVTDSLDDADLLQACATPLHVRWRAARWEGAMSTAYQPFLYTRQGKRAGQRYLLHHVLLEDVVVLVLALAWAMPRPFLGAAGLLLLHLSFWLVYEIGYWENDTLAVRRESRPVVPTGSAAVAGRMKPRSAWAAAVVLSVPGVLLLALGAGGSLRAWTGAFGTGWPSVGLLAAGWLAYLLASRGVYWLYNRLAPQARVLPYALLQVTRTIGYTVFCVVSPIGAAALLAVVLVRWMVYVSYRATGVQPDVSHRLLLLFSFLVLATGALAVAPLDLSAGLQAGVVLLVLAARAHRPLRALGGVVVGDRGRTAATAERPGGAPSSERSRASS